MTKNPFLKTTLCLLLFACIAPSCKKDGDPSTPVEPPVNNSINARLWHIGFDTSSVKPYKDGYLVENCIFITEDQIKQEEQKNSRLQLRTAGSEQYRASNIVTGLPRVIDFGHSGGVPSALYMGAFMEVIGRYNDIKLDITFEYYGSGTDITFVPTYDPSPTAPSAYAAYPSGGNPGATIHYNTYQLDSKTAAQIASVLQHEIGHALGLRHTDYNGRGSCDPIYQGNEGAGSVGVAHIPGTPTASDPYSLMLACYNPALPSFSFNVNDIRALSYLYKAGGDPGAQLIHEYYNNGFQDNCLSADPNVANMFPGWAYMGSSYRAFITSATPGTVAIYEYYNPVDGDHTYSTSPVDWNILQHPNWVKNNNDPVFYVYPSSFTGAVTVYRYYNAGEKRHLFTPVPNIHMLYSGWTSPTIAWYGAPK